MVDNTLDRQFDVAAPDTAWVSDITYIKTYEGFLYLAVVTDLYSRRVIGWATSHASQPTLFFRRYSWPSGDANPSTLS